MTKIKRSREMLDTAMLVINNSTDEPFKANVESAIVLLEVYTWGTSETLEEGGLPSIEPSSLHRKPRESCSTLSKALGMTSEARRWKDDQNISINFIGKEQDGPCQLAQPEYVADAFSGTSPDTRNKRSRMGALFDGEVAWRH